MEPHQSMEQQQRESVLLSKPQQLQQQNVVEEEEKVPRPHRCNDRLEDIVQALFEGDPRKTLPGPFKLYWKCMQSKPGEEPTEPFFFLEVDSKGKVSPKGRST
ncbi:unnamed protein product [Sphagnum tenellum]|jgi:hypothetical protein